MKTVEQNVLNVLQQYKGAFHTLQTLPFKGVRKDPYLGRELNCLRLVLFGMNMGKSRLIHGNDPPFSPTLSAPNTKA